LYEEIFEHATKLIDDVRSIANDPIPRELISNGFELS
jgi:hypothetical protein